jgi:MSHA type pilus biogenesis protein MshL
MAAPASQELRNTAAQSVPCRGLTFTSLGVFAALALLASCATYKPTIPPSDAHISRDTVDLTPETEKILPPITVSDYLPRPKPQVKLPTYSVVVNEVPVKELLFALARDTKQNIDVHPGVRGVVSLNAIDETFPAILERISYQVNIRYETKGKTILVVPDTQYFKTYVIDYVNVNRNSTGSLGVKGDITTTMVGDRQSGSQGSDETGGSSTTIGSKSDADFWAVLRANLESILSATNALAATADEKAARAEAEQKARQERIAQAEAVAGAGDNAAGLFDAAFGPAQTANIDIRDKVVINSVAGSVTVLGTEKQQELVQRYLDGITSSTQRQVLIEATIAEVQLSNEYQAGVDWSRIAGGTGFSFSQELLGANLGAAPRMLIGYANATSEIGNISASIALLQQFGNTRVLSSPKIMALNNQPAILKVIDNIVYFNVEVETLLPAVGTGLQTFDTSVRTVPVGLVMSVTPQISESGMVSMTIRPTISRVVRFVNDPNPALVTAGVTNPVPEIQTREMESMLQVGSGQTVVLGGLMQDNVRRDRDQVPFVGDLPNVGDVFAYRDEEVTKNELIVFLKVTVITNPSLDSDELRFFQRLLPTIDPTGENP